MALASGARLGPYEVVEPIGEGGMGQVYRARDTKLNRDVALKVLHESVTTDPDRLARFQREAELLAALNHPNIAQIYGLEDSGDTTALVLELIEGPTLAERIRQGAIPLDEALPIATQIATALEAAHEQGIIHRDLKPANIKLAPDGTVKVLDFGLAKALDDAPATDASESPTVATAITGMGVIMGTAAYMSPEQARGKPVDRRADIWAFGVVLYEMLAGKRAFEAEDVSLTLAEVMKSEPDWSALPEGVSPTLKLYLMRCFAKNPAERVRDIGDVRLALAGAFDVAPAPPSAAATVAPSASMKWLAVSAVVAAAAAGLAAWHLKPAEPKPVIRLVHELPSGQELSPAFSVLSLSPDARSIVYVANFRLFIRRLDEIVARPIPGVDRGERVGDPVFSPDGEWVAYMSFTSGQLKKAAVGGGAPVVIVEAGRQTRGLDWTREGTLVFATDEGVFRVSADGGVPETLSDARVSYPRMLPGSDALLVTREVTSGRQRMIAVVSLESGEIQDLVEGDTANYVAPGHLVVARGDALFAAGFDVDRRKLTGALIPVGEGVGKVIGRAQLAVSDAGALAYLDGAGEQARIALRRLGLAALDTTEPSVELLNVPAAEYSSPRLSPDGRNLAVQTMDVDGIGTIWVYEIGGDRALRQLTFTGSNLRPVWTPDGERIAFASDRDGAMSIYWKPADGSGAAERLTTAEGAEQHFPASWTPDGDVLAYTVERGGDWDIWTLSLEDGPKGLYDDPERPHLAPEISPGGNWIAYQTGDFIPSIDVYVEPFPPTGARHKISSDYGFFPMWSKDGSQLFYRPVSSSREITLRRVDVSFEPSFGFSYETTMPLKPFVVEAFQREYSISPDGKTMLMVYPSESDESITQPAPRIQIVVNWVEELKARVPVN